MDNCTEWMAHGFYRRRCHNRAWKDGYCIQHHPGGVAQRDELELYLAFVAAYDKADEADRLYIDGTGTMGAYVKAKNHCDAARQALAKVCPVE